jgi:aminoglycoside 6-adenylyltransferase
MLDSVIRFSYLQKVIEWHIGLQYQWHVSTNRHGRFFEKYLDPENWDKLQATFAGHGMEESWDALFATTKLFSQLAKAIAKELDYFYPHKTDDEISAYLGKIKTLDNHAVDIK